jgi:hypothetical protein
MSALLGTVPHLFALGATQIAVLLYSPEETRCGTVAADGIEPPTTAPCGAACMSLPTRNGTSILYPTPKCYVTSQ